MNTITPHQFFKNLIVQVVLHFRMREPSSALVTAAHRNAVIGVLFDVDYDFIVRNRCFRYGNALRFLKNF